jgi:hypothetical protein
MQNQAWLVGLVSWSLLAGCAGPFQYTPRALSPAKWQAASVSVVIEDKRATASTTLPSVPVVTLGGGRENDLRLPPEFSEFVRWRLSQLITRRGPRIRLTILPETVRAGWSASVWSETEQANVSLRFRVSNEDGSHVLFEGVGKAQQVFSSADASNQELAQVFRAACNDAFDAFFASAANVRRLNDAAAGGTEPAVTPSASQ